MGMELFHNLGYDAESILKLVGDGLNVYAATCKTSFEYKDSCIKFVPSKYLRISKGHHTSTFFDIAQYYNRVSLVKACISKKAKKHAWGGEACLPRKW